MHNNPIVTPHPPHHPTIGVKVDMLARYQVDYALTLKTTLPKGEHKMIQNKDKEFYQSLVESVLEDATNPNKKTNHRDAVAVGYIGTHNLTDLEIKKYWADYSTPEVVAACALSEEIPESMLSRGVVIDNPVVQQALARNARTPKKLLKALASVDTEDVRIAVAHNPNAPLAAVVALQSDSSEKVRKAADSRRA